MVAIAVILLTAFHPAIFFPLLRQDHRKAAAAQSVSPEPVETPP